MPYYPKITFPPVPCQHIADYYHYLWTARKCTTFNLLRHGYQQWAAGEVELYVNDLYDI